MIDLHPIIPAPPVFSFYFLGDADSRHNLRDLANRFFQLSQLYPDTRAVFRFNDEKLLKWRLIEPRKQKKERAISPAEFMAILPHRLAELLYTDPNREKDAIHSIIDRWSSRCIYSRNSRRWTLPNFYIAAAVACEFFGSHWSSNLAMSDAVSKVGPRIKDYVVACRALEIEEPKEREFTQQQITERAYRLSNVSPDKHLFAAASTFGLFEAGAKKGMRLSPFGRRMAEWLKTTTTADGT